MAYTTIDKPSDYFTAFLRVGVYAGSGTTDFNIGFKPDLVWDKNRTGTSNHDLIDSVRGGGINLNTNDTSVDATGANVTSFLSNGFQITNFNDWGSDRNIVDWCWKAGGSASTNTSGSTNTSVSVNTDAGFSIVTYPGNSTSGATFGHGLGVKPSMIITKARTRLSMWNVYHKGLTNYTKGIYLNATDAEFAGGAFEAGEPNATTFTLTNGTHVNGSGETYVAYCFAEKKGYSKFGSYVGNGNADGTFVYTGFKPAFVMIKSSSNSGQAWVMQDNKRDGFNYNNHRLFANSNATEESTVRMDLLSNGFKCRDNDGNGNGFNYIYMAFAEESFVSSSGVPATAR